MKPVPLSFRIENHLGKQVVQPIKASTGEPIAGVFESTLSTGVDQQTVLTFSCYIDLKKARVIREAHYKRELECDMDGPKAAYREFLVDRPVGHDARAAIGLPKPGDVHPDCDALVVSVEQPPSRIWEGDEWVVPVLYSRKPAELTADEATRIKVAFEKSINDGQQRKTVIASGECLSSSPRRWWQFWR
jgi:hypothetical protein